MASKESRVINKRKKIDNKNMDYNDLQIEPNKTKKRYDNDIGARIMAKLGYEKNKGLGKHNQGILEPISFSNQKGRRGIGYVLKEIKIDSLYTWDAKKEASYIQIPEKIKWLSNPHTNVPEKKELEKYCKKGDKKLKIDEDENQFCDPAVFKGVYTCKSVFDQISIEEVKQARSRSNPFELIGKSIFQNRAALKMANLDYLCDFMFTNTSESNELLYFADICAGPGGFTEYVLWRKGWEAKGFGFTLKDGIDFKFNEFLAASPVTFEAHYGELNDGNIYEPKNLISFRNYVNISTNGVGVHFAMADGGFSVKGQENIQEILSKRLYLCQFACALSIIRNGGHFVCKLFDIFTNFSVGLIYLIYRCFNEIAIVKPNSSRPANSERYIICKSKKQHTDEVAAYLFFVNCYLDMLEKKESDQDIFQVYPLEKLKEDEAFYRYIHSSNSIIGGRQIVFLSKIKSFLEDSSLTENKQNEIKKACLEIWKIDSNSRCLKSVQNFNPQKKLKELITKNELSYNLTESTLLNKENLKDLKYPWRFKFMVMSESSKTFGKGFYLSLGDNFIYFWNGLSLSSKLHRCENLKFELPPETILFGEQVEERKGEGKAQRKIQTFHIIDILLLNGCNFQTRLFSERNLIAFKLVKALFKQSQALRFQLRAKKIYDLIFLDDIFKLDFDMKEIKSGAQRERLCYIVEKVPQIDKKDEERFIIPSGLLIINEISKPWVRELSKSGKKFYYYNVETDSSIFECPSQAVLSFSSIFSNSIFWKWLSDEDLMIANQRSKDYKMKENQINREILQDFIQSKIIERIGHEDANKYVINGM